MQKAVIRRKGRKERPTRKKPMPKEKKKKEIKAALSSEKGLLLEERERGWQDQARKKGKGRQGKGQRG